MDRVGGVLVETYRIERLIAEGSMGTVYEARHLRIPKRFAVKFLRLGLEGNQEALERFRREAEVVATIDHPNVVGLFDYNVGDDGVPYIVLEYLDGEHLAARLSRQRKQALPEALRIVDAVGGALAAAHARNVIHRDLKPENIVLCTSGRVKVVDFGVAKLRGAPELTAVNTIVGTVPYMAPEQLMGGVLDARVDQYALATIAYEMLAGEMAFDGSGAVADVARRVLTHQPPFLADVPQAVNDVIFRAMSRAARARFPSVSEFVAALRSAAAESETAAVDTGELPPLAGEVTRITAADGTAAEDDDDPVAPPPDDLPTRPEETVGARAGDDDDDEATQLAEAHAPGHVTAEMPAFSPDGDKTVRGRDASAAAEADVDTDPTAAAERTGEQPALPPLKTLIVDGAGGPKPPAVTARSMAAVTAPSGWDAVRNDATLRSTLLPARTRWVLLGILVGLAVAIGAVLALR